MPLPVAHRSLRELDVTIGQAVADARVLAGLSQRKAGAKLLGVSPQAWAKYERGHTPMTVALFVYLARQLGLDPAAVLARALSAAPPPAEDELPNAHAFRKRLRLAKAVQELPEEQADQVAALVETMLPVSRILEERRPSAAAVSPPASHACEARAAA
jgi:transcriptional regulator with XRE-family HTH domain